MPNFNQNKQWINNIIYHNGIILDGTVLDEIICFSVRFSNNLLLVLKMRFQVFSFAGKKVQGFSSDRKMLK